MIKKCKLHNNYQLYHKYCFSHKYLIMYLTKRNDINVDKYTIYDIK